MKHLARTRRHAGFSITELMVAMTIGLIILAAVATIFVNANKASNNQNRAAQVQENGRFAMYYLLRDLRMAGYMGCQNDVGDLLTNDLTTTTGFFFAKTSLAIPIEGIDDVTANTNEPWAPSGINYAPGNIWNSGATATNAKPDAITIRLVDTSARQLITAPMTQLSDSLSVTDASKFQSNPVVMVADCAKADLAQVSGTNTGTTPNQVSLAASLSKLYGTTGNTAYVYPYYTRTYYIGLNANSVPSLYRVDNGGTAVELVQGIESMKFLYGIATPPNTQPSTYLKASAMTASDWANVVSVKIAILALTPNTKDTDIDNNTYDLDGTVIQPFGDRNSRRIFTATTMLKDSL